jgi:CheY-like chemotaxis protein
VDPGLAESARSAGGSDLVACRGPRPFERFAAVSKGRTRDAADAIAAAIVPRNHGGVWHDAMTGIRAWGAPRVRPSTERPALTRILIVEPDDALREAIALDAEGWPLCEPAGGGEVREGPDANAIAAIASADQATALLARDPELLLVDVDDGGAGLDLLRMAGERRLAPARIAMSGRASAEEAFELGGLGVRGYLAKPFTLGELRELVDRAVNTAPSIDAVASAQVRHVPILTVQDQVKQVMLEQALARSGGNFVQTARLLGVTRQAVQQMVRRYEIER